VGIAAGVNCDWDTDMIPGQYASNEWRKWYLMHFTLGQIYTILDNDETQLFLDRSIEDDGGSVDDAVLMYADRFVYRFSSLQKYARVGFEMLATSAPPVLVYPDNNQRRLGTIVLGRAYDLPDDKWEMSITTQPSVQQQVSRSGRERVWETAQEQRIINLAYTGLTDRSQGIEAVKEFHRVLRWGENPLVFVDHDDRFTNLGTGANEYEMGPVEPILGRFVGNYTQNRIGYRLMDQNGMEQIRNYLESGLRIEEIL